MCTYVQNYMNKYEKCLIVMHFEVVMQNKLSTTHVYDCRVRNLECLVSKNPEFFNMVK